MKKRHTSVTADCHDKECCIVNTADKTLLRLGLLIPFWLFTGVTLTALAYPGYSHIDQAMSQLGAMDTPTHAISPWVNNLPLGVLFLLFGAGIGRRFRRAGLARLSALLIMIHGLASLATGLFSCDAGCAPPQPSASQQIHNAAGLIMFLSLTLATGLWAILGKTLLSSSRFAWFSAICTLLAVITVGLMAQAVESGHGFGLYQRINYGISVLWIAALAWMALNTVSQGAGYDRER
ncbi:DUF998 domain-containing protein [Pseudomonas sp. JDS28PS106]|uniref:DUF998 domain-containing protein n=1 Tax=Pseudomonas sp. JDS28PS106 TaxID=2497235 RepID=UPI003FA7733D